MISAAAKSLTCIAGCLAVVTAGTVLAAASGAAAGAVIELRSQDRKEIEKYLGKGVVGKAVEARSIDDPAKFMGMGHEPQHLTVKVVHGKMAGKTREISIGPLDRKDERPAWRLEAGDDVWFGEVDENGNFVQYTTQDCKQGVITRYDPPEPILYKGMKPGDSERFRIDVAVFDLARPDRKKYQGYLDVTYSYLGAYEVAVPAGTYNAVLFKWSYVGKVGPAKIKDDQYFFFAEGIGPIARIHKKDISAAIVYRDKTKVAGVLTSRH